MATKKHTAQDARINRDNNFGDYCKLAAELTEQATGMKRTFSVGTMTWNTFHSTSYRHTYRDSLVDVTMDFNKHEAIITVED